MRTRLTGLTGWKRLLAAAMAGIAATLAMPPLGATPALAAGLVALAWLLAGTARFGDAFLTVFAFAFGFFAAGFYWIAGAFFVGGGALAAAGGIAIVLGLAALSAFFPALATALAHRLTQPGIGRALALAAALGLGDWLRGHLLTGFPWNLFGYAWLHVPAVEQAAAVVGIYGVGLATLAVCLLLSVPDRRAWTAAALAVAAMFAYGELRLGRAPPTEAARGPLLRLVQPNIPQSEKWRPEKADAHMQRLARLTSAGPEPDAAIWPETAIAWLLHAGSPLVEALGKSVESRRGLISGAPWIEDGRFRNSILAIDREGRLQGRHDKAHLVPLGEYTPLPGLLGASTLTLDGDGFAAGPGPSTLVLPGLPPFGALVCFEAIFPGEVVDAANRPEWLLNLTNDAWFGETAGPHQHFEIARMRAIETGLPVLRVANTGITGAVDGYGRRLGRLEPGTIGSLDVRLPAPLAETPYGSLGDLPFFAGIGLLAVFAGWRYPGSGASTTISGCFRRRRAQGRS